MKGKPTNKKFLMVDPCGNCVLLTMENIKDVEELRKQLSDPEIIKKVNRHDTMNELLTYIRKYIRGEADE